MVQQPNEKVYRSKKEMMWSNFLGGIAWGLGITIGLSIVFAILDYLLHQISVIPVIGNFIISIVDYVKHHG